MFVFMSLSTLVLMYIYTCESLSEAKMQINARKICLNLGVPYMTHWDKGYFVCVIYDPLGFWGMVYVFVFTNLIVKTSKLFFFFIHLFVVSQAR